MNVAHNLKNYFLCCVDDHKCFGSPIKGWNLQNDYQNTKQGRFGQTSLDRIYTVCQDLFWGRQLVFENLLHLSQIPKYYKIPLCPHSTLSNMNLSPNVYCTILSILLPFLILDMVTSCLTHVSNIVAHS